MPFVVWHIRQMRRSACLLLVLVAAGCGGEDKPAAPAAGAEPKAVLAVAREHVGEREATRTTQDVTIDGDRATATITFEGLYDDSVRGERHVVTLEREEGRWHVLDDDVTYCCQNGRGHQDFSAELCL